MAVRSVFKVFVLFAVSLALQPAMGATLKSSSLYIIPTYYHELVWLSDDTVAFLASPSDNEERDRPSVFIWKAGSTPAEVVPTGAYSRSSQEFYSVGDGMGLAKLTESVPQKNDPKITNEVQRYFKLDSRSATAISQQEYDALKAGQSFGDKDEIALQALAKNIAGMTDDKVEAVTAADHRSALVYRPDPSGNWGNTNCPYVRMVDFAAKTAPPYCVEADTPGDVFVYPRITAKGVVMIATGDRNLWNERSFGVYAAEGERGTNLNPGKYIATAIVSPTLCKIALLQRDAPVGAGINIGPLGLTLDILDVCAN